MKYPVGIFERALIWAFSWGANAVSHVEHEIAVRRSEPPVVPSSYPHHIDDDDPLLQIASREEWQEMERNALNNV